MKKLKKYALLVGINAYGGHSRLNPLMYAEADTALMASCMEEFGFQTRVMTGEAATALKIEKELRNIEQEKKDILVFFFAGHGQELKGQHQLYCYGSEEGYTTGALQTSQLLKRIKYNQNVLQALVLLDACRNELAGSRGGAAGASSYNDIERVINETREVIPSGLGGGEAGFKVIDSQRKTRPHG